MGDCLSLTQEQMPCVARMMRIDGKEATRKNLAIMLSGYILSLPNLKNKPDPTDIIDIVDAMMDYGEELYMMTPADIKIFFKKVRRGGYGEFYERLDASKLVPWMKEYCSDRAAEALRMRRREERERKKDEKETDPWILRHYQPTMVSDGVDADGNELTHVEMKPKPRDESREREAEEKRRKNQEILNGIRERAQELTAGGVNAGQAYEQAYNEYHEQHPDN